MRRPSKGTFAMLGLLAILVNVARADDTVTMEPDFLVQITRLVPDKLMVIANLPSTFEGEGSTGVGVMTLNETADNTTVVDLTMSRRYVWQGSGTNSQQAVRESAAFSASTAAMWEAFLAKLKALAERDA